MRLHDGSRERIEGTPEAPRFEDFADDFLAICRARNKPSEAQTKEMILRVHLTPAFGKRRLGSDRYDEVLDYAARKTGKLSAKSVNNHCTTDGRMLQKSECKHPLWRACRRAGLRSWKQPAKPSALLSVVWSQQVGDVDPEPFGEKFHRPERHVYCPVLDLLVVADV